MPVMSWLGAFFAILQIEQLYPEESNTLVCFANGANLAACGTCCEAKKAAGCASAMQLAVQLAVQLDVRSHVFDEMKYECVLKWYQG
jgi:hypothetical protein